MSNAEGSGNWRCTQHWPPPELNNRIFHLHPGALSAVPASDSNTPCTRFSGNCRNPPRLKGDPVDFSCHPAVNNDGIPTAYTGENAVFSAGILPTSLELLGIPHLMLWVTCDRCDGVIAARLTIHFPPGTSLPPQIISTGICRIALRNDPLMPLPCECGDSPVCLHIELQPLACRLPAGSILHLELSSGESPRYLPVLLDSSSPLRRREIGIWHTPRYSSRLILPVLNKAPPAV